MISLFACERDNRLVGESHAPTSDAESEWEDVDEDEEDDLPDLAEVSESEGSDTFDESNPTYLLEIPRMRHWSETIASQVWLLQQRIEHALMHVFEATPSLSLYSTLRTMSHDPLNASERMLSMLQSMATSCSDVYAVALDVYALEHKIDLIVALLDSHSHLLRPRDMGALQSATIVLSHHGHSGRALKLLEAELLDTLHATRQALLQSFSQLDTPANRAELTQIIRMRSGAAGRRNRVEAWVDAVTTPGADQPNPVMFAAMMMGIGPVPGLNPDDDPYTYLDLDPLDPDLEDLRSEYRPKLKRRFESWADIGLRLKGGAPMLLTIYRKIIETLPFLRASDITEEMISR